MALGMVENSIHLVETLRPIKCTINPNAESRDDKEHQRCTLPTRISSK